MKAEIGMDVDGKPFLVVIAESQTECSMMAFAAKALGLGYDCTDGSAVLYAKPEATP